MPHGADIYAESEMLKGLPDSRCNSTVQVTVKMTFHRLMTKSDQFVKAAETRADSISGYVIL